MGEKVFVDANIFLEIFLKDSKSEECKDFLKSLKDENKTAFTTDFLSYICILVIQNNLKESKFIRDAIIFFSYYEDLVILRPSFDELYSAGEIMDNDKLDFDDSLVVACMRKYGIKEIASLDKHFDKIKDIKRII